MHKLSHQSALTTSRIIAHKRSGNALVYLAQEGSTFFLRFGRITDGGGTGSHFRPIAEKPLTPSEAHEVLINIFHVSDSEKVSVPAESTQTILLEVAKVLDIPYTEFVGNVSIESPYFPTKEIFLSYQKTRGPNALM